MLLPCEHTGKKSPSTHTHTQGVPKVETVLVMLFDLVQWEEDIILKSFSFCLITHFIKRVGKSLGLRYLRLHWGAWQTDDRVKMPQLQEVGERWLFAAANIQKSIIPNAQIEIIH